MTERLALLLLVLSSCRSGFLFGGPVTGTVQNRVQGGCVAQCLDGTECDTKSGLCVQNPCAGKCLLARCDQLAVPPVCR